MRTARRCAKWDKRARGLRRSISIRLTGVTVRMPCLLQYIGFRGPEDYYGARSMPRRLPARHALPGHEGRRLPREWLPHGRARLVRGVGDDVGVQRRVPRGSGPADAGLPRQALARLRGAVLRPVRCGIAPRRLGHGALEQDEARIIT